MKKCGNWKISRKFDNWLRKKAESGCQEILLEALDQSNLTEELGILLVVEFIVVVPLYEGFLCKNIIAEENLNTEASQINQMLEIF